MKEILLKALVILHVAGGGTALVTGLITLSTPKGGKVHRPVGKVFFIAMLVVSVSAFIISVIKSLSFLLAISVFSFYMNYTGYRALKNRTGKFTWYDWLPVTFSVITAVYMLTSFQIVLVVFGLLLASFLIQDIRLQLKGDEEIKAERRTRILTHLARMAGTYIATVTAFLVVNINFVKPHWLLWLLPTAIGTPFIVYWTRQWRKKLKLAA